MQMFDGTATDAAQAFGTTDLKSAQPISLNFDLDTLEQMSFWRESLSERIAQARLKFELVGVGREEIIALAAETAEFKRACQVLKGVMGNA
jgi:hypothetical protein